MVSSSLRKTWVVLALFLAYGGRGAHAQPDQPLDDDLYTARLAEKGETLAKESPWRKALELPPLPLDLVRYGLDKTIYAVDHYHIDDKLQWMYEEITNYGIYPKLRGTASIAEVGAGVDVDFVKLARQKARFPYARLRGRLDWIHSELFRVSSEVGIDKLHEVGPYGAFYFNYEDRPEEDFFGIGPNTSLGDGTSFNSEITTLSLRGGYSFSLNTDLRTWVAYKNANITNGQDGGKGIIDLIFPAGSIPGLAGGEFLITGLEFIHDTRDFPEDPHKGGFLNFKASYHEGVTGSDFGFFKYRGEIARFHELFSERQVLAVRFVGEHNDELNDRAVPFFEMARLGGYGVSPSLGDTHRGFQKNRFFGESNLLMNLEFRYVVWQYKDLSLDAVIFWDEGQVFNELSEFQFKDFRESIGGGFRFKVLRKSILSVEAARSDEGLEFYARADTPF
jgi:hypothetical protein